MSIGLYGPMTIGSTEIVSVYVLIRSLEAIKSWIEGNFPGAMKVWFLASEDESHSRRGATVGSSEQREGT
ncbi:hypothetical protein F4801DRAFT_553917 [Xylaria longipes]|nr:hypothetical protein F4801DRAFT_553917 [Xylaria longipes]